MQGAWGVSKLVFFALTGILKYLVDSKQFKNLVERGFLDKRYYNRK